MKTYYKDNSRYPFTGEGIQILVGKYMKKHPKDAWGREIMYVNTNGMIDIYSLDKDGVLGGSGEDYDIHVQLFSRVEPYYSLDL